MVYRGLQSNELVKARRQRLLAREEKGRILAEAKRLLEVEPRILLAVVFGSFTKSNLVRDLDIAVYLAKPRDTIEDYDYCESLARRLTTRLGILVNIVALNHARDSVFNEALATGTPLVVREPWLYEALKLLALEQLNRFHYNKPK